MINILRKHEQEGQRIRVAVVGLGSMGVGVARQIARTPGMCVVAVADLDQAVLDRHAAVLDELREDHADLEVSTDALALLGSAGYDVLAECSTAISDALEYCLKAIERQAHVVLMNAEVDIAFGRLLKHEADKAGVVFSSDAGDQHGVIAQLWNEMQLWGMEMVQAGNIKGFLNRYATPESLQEEAARRRLNPVPCCGYTDGTKLNIEMALLSNAYGWKPHVRGMEGPRVVHVDDLLDGVFDYDAYNGEGKVDYILGGKPGGGVYCIGRVTDRLKEFQQPYLSYYKLGDGPYYVLYRPYHLCHMETPLTVARVALLGQPLLQPWKGYVADVYAFAKRDIAAGGVIEHGIGGGQFYGMIESVEVAGKEGLVPIWMIEPDSKGNRATLTDAVSRDGGLTLDSVGFPDSYMHQMATKQRELAG